MVMPFMFTCSSILLYSQPFDDFKSSSSSSKKVLGNQIDYAAPPPPHLDKMLAFSIFYVSLLQNQITVPIMVETHAKTTGGGKGKTIALLLFYVENAPCALA